MRVAVGYTFTELHHEFLYHFIAERLVLRNALHVSFQVEFEKLEHQIKLVCVGMDYVVKTNDVVVLEFL